MDHVERRAKTRVTDVLQDTRVVTVVGPRQAGKSTLAREIALSHGGEYLTLDDSATLQAARNDPQGFVNRASKLLVIDEIQRAPSLVLAIKLAVDGDPTPGRFLLTGSTHLLSVREVADALAGRMEMISMWPLSQSEFRSSNLSFLDRVFCNGHVPMGSSGLRRTDYLSLVEAGGFPEAVGRPPTRRSDWFRAYAATVIEREGKEVMDADRGNELSRLLRFVAGRHGGLLNVADLARDAGLTERTTHRYLHVLESVFLITRTEPWWVNLTSRLTKAPKVFVADSGLANFLCRGSSSDPAAAGALVEGFAVEEIRRQLSWSQHRGELFRYRDKTGREVDAIIELDDGRVLAIEVKAGESLDSKSFSALTYLRDAIGPRFAAGIVVHAGETTHAHGDRLWSTSIANLWS